MTWVAALEVIAVGVLAAGVALLSLPWLPLPFWPVPVEPFCLPSPLLTTEETACPELFAAETIDDFA